MCVCAHAHTYVTFNKLLRHLSKDVKKAAGLIRLELRGADR